MRTSKKMGLVLVLILISMLCFPLIKVVPVTASEFGDPSVGSHGSETVPFSYPSKITVVETITEIDPGMWLYSYDIIQNDETSEIWWLGLWTDFEMYDLTTFEETPTWATSIHPVEETWMEPPPNMTWKASTWAPDWYDDPNPIAVGELVHNFSFTGNYLNRMPKTYHYNTVAYGYNSEEVTALGITVSYYEHELIVSLDAPTFLNPGDSSLLNTTILNIGLSNETDVKLFLLINGTVVNNVTIPKLVNGTSFPIDYLWTPTVEATYNITAYAPPVPNETFTGNNVATKMVVVLQIRDVAIISVTTSATEVYKGQIVNITVVAKNEGSVNETFDVTTYYDTSVIGIQSVTNLTASANVTLTFSWDTSGVEPNFISYTIKTVASTVPDEIDKTDNIRIAGTVKVRLPGDVNGDGKVDIKDIITVALAFGSKPGDPNWNPDADLHEDGVIDIFDLVTVAINHGERLPLPPQTVYVDPPSTTVAVGSTFTVNIIIYNVTDLYGWELTLYYDTVLLDPYPNITHCATEGPFLKQGGTTHWMFGSHRSTDTYNATHGRIHVGCTLLIGPYPGVNGSGVLATFTFITTAVGGPSAISIVDSYLTDHYVEDIPHTTIDGYVTIISATHQ